MKKYLMLWLLNNYYYHKNLYLFKNNLFKIYFISYVRLFRFFVNAITKLRLKIGDGAFGIVFADDEYVYKYSKKKIIIMIY